MKLMLATFTLFYVMILEIVGAKSLVKLAVTKYNADWETVESNWINIDHAEYIPDILFYDRVNHLAKKVPNEDYEPRRRTLNEDPYIALLDKVPKHGTEGYQGMTKAADPVVMSVSKHQPEVIQEDLHLKFKTDPDIILYQNVNDVPKPGPEDIHNNPQGETKAVDPYIMLYDRISDVSKHQLEGVQEDSQIKSKTYPDVMLYEKVNDVSKHGTEDIHNDSQGETKAVDPYIMLYDRISSDISKFQPEEVQEDSQIKSKTYPDIMLYEKMNDVSKHGTEDIHNDSQGETKAVDPYIMLYDRISDVSMHQLEGVERDSQIKSKSYPDIMYEKVNDVSKHGAEDIHNDSQGETKAVDPYIMLYDRISDVSKHQLEGVEGDSQIKSKSYPDIMYEKVNDVSKHGAEDIHNDSQGETKAVDPYIMLYDRISDVSKHQLEEDQEDSLIKSKTDIDIMLHQNVNDVPKPGPEAIQNDSFTTIIPEVIPTKPSVSQGPFVEFVNGFLDASANLLERVLDVVGNLLNSILAKN